MGLTVSWASCAKAQIVDGWSWSILVPSVGRTDPLGMFLNDRRREDEARQRRALPRTPELPETRNAPPGDASSLRYLPTKARRSANLAAFVQKTRATDPRGAADLQKLFAEGDFIEKIGALVAPQGLHIDNVADAYALWWITAWQAAHGNNDTPSRAVLGAVRQQAANAVTATDEIARASDAQKQELAEALWVQSALIDGAVEQAKRDPSRLRAVGDVVRKGAKGMGLNLDALDLTSQGFVPASVGRNDTLHQTPGNGGTSPAFGVVALAAGGMGVGGLLLLRQRRG
ncbi:DUF6683 family protein [uncultured Sphingomonas sp.]|uniref:DUF6683 family protein n=1 Tax=uncultured Sphingomonas sp. TaxID=158754 RepID=UPI0025EBAFC2|nr:DUF6683 family protein [uncultured Sphingomonas sp.]